MHIAAYMAACDIDDLDHMAKVAVEKVAGRANPHTGVAWVSTGRIADDLGVHYDTAWRALRRAVDSGYLTVDKSAGGRPKWQLTSRLARDPTPRADDRTDAEVLPRRRGGALAERGTKETLDPLERARAPHTNQKRAGGARSKEKTVDPSPSSASPPSRASFSPGSGYLEDWSEPKPNGSHT